MKKSVYILKTGVFLLFCLLAACSSDDNTPKPELTPEELILGKWYFVKIVQSDGTVWLPENDCEGQSYYAFEASGVMSQGLYTLDGTACKNSISTASYEFIANGEKLLVSSDGTTNIVEIITLNERTLELNATGSKGVLEKR